MFAYEKDKEKLEIVGTIVIEELKSKKSKIIESPIILRTID